MKPRPGNALRLTLDIKLQRAAERALRTGINLAHVNGDWAADGGAVVALDVPQVAHLAASRSRRWAKNASTARSGPSPPEIPSQLSLIAPTRP